MKRKPVIMLVGLAAIACLAFLTVVDLVRQERPFPVGQAASQPAAAAAPRTPDADRSAPTPARPHASDDALIHMPELPPAQDVLWEKPSATGPVEAFRKWTSAYTLMAAAEKAGAAAEGTRLARERRESMRILIRRNPEEALASAVPESVRRELPPEVIALLEEKVDARGDLIATAASTPDGRLPQGRRAERTRAVLDDGRKLEAFVYGNREFQPSRVNVPIHGIAIDGALAVSQWPGRVLEPAERDEAKQTLGIEPVCPTSGLAVSETGTETAIITGSDVQFYCGPEHARSELQHAAAEELIRPPGLGVRTASTVNAASGGAGQSVPNFLSEGDASWTTGNKRIGIVRVTFNGTNYHYFNEAQCTTIVNDMGAAWNDWSYGRCKIRSVSSTGSFITPVLDLPKSAFNYEEDDIDTLWTIAEIFTWANGHPPGSYDYLMVLSGDAPILDDDNKIVWWGGLGRIGGPYTWIRSTTVESATRVGLHELGHNLGLRHSSNLWVTPQVVFPEEGLPYAVLGEEYGDRYDRMGRGSEDYNVRYKDWLQWLDDGNLPLASTDGRYTLREHDLEEKSGVRGLQVAFNLGNSIIGAEDSLFVEYRLYDTANPLLAYGAHIHLGSPSKPKTYLLDCTPETLNTEPEDANGDADISGNLDSLLLPGRTYSYTKYGVTVHITNISADPDSGEMEVEIKHGTPAGNDAPAGSITSNTPTGATGQKIYFTANASDADGDELAYHWQIPGAGPFENKSTASATFNSTGAKTIKCLVSDKHGGVTTLTKNFSVAANQPPSISAISDQTIDEDAVLLNLPFTVSDATTPAGSLTVTAVTSDAYLFPAGSIVVGTVSGGNRKISLTPPANRHGTATITVTVSDGGLQDTEEFKMTVRPVTPGTTLIATGSLWRYWDASAAPSGNWKVPVYNETGWGNDNARFVYPAPPFNIFGWTVLGSPAPSRSTCYFRKSFNMPASPVGTPTLRLLCDDGAVVYANGLEIYRQNMPDGAVTHTTRAESSVEGFKQSTWTLVPLNMASFHTGGSNTIAVEVHDAAGSRGGGDVAFDFEFALLEAPTVSNITDKFSPEDQVAGAYSFTATESETPPGTLFYSGTSSNQALVLDANVKVGFSIFTSSRYATCTPQPNATGVTEITLKVSDGSSETWEKFNLTITPVNDAPWLTPLADAAVALGEIAPLVEVQIGDVDTDAGSLTVTASSSNQSFLPNAGIQVLPGTAPDRRWLRITPTPGIAAQANVTVNVSDGAASTNDTFIFRVGFPINVTGADIRFMRSGDTWRYWAAALPLDGHGQPVDFTDPGLDDRAWPSGTSQLGYGNDGEATDLPVTPYRVTTYFRKKFTVPNRASVSQLKMRMLRDDGAVVYLNGASVWTSNMPRVTITSATLADTDISGAGEDAWHSLATGTTELLSGSNTIAVELHQSVMPAGLAPGDLSFDFELDGVPAAPTAPDTLVAPGEMWAYWDQPGYPDITWKLATFAEDGWKFGLARLGYGIGGESTVVNANDSSGLQRNPSVLFRKVFDVVDPSMYTALHLFTQRDDGIAVHLNGIRVHFENLASNASPGDLATVEAPAGEQTQWRHYLVDHKRLLAGRNLLAVEIHQNSLTGTDLNFDLQLTGDLSGIPNLYLRPAGNNMELSWPAAYNGWNLRASTDLLNWSTPAEPALLDAGWLYVTTPGSPPRRFFRLEKP